MSVSVDYNGVTYRLPTPGDVDWGSALTSFLQAIALNTLTVDGVQTLTNKTLTAPVLTTAVASSTSGAAITATTTGANATAIVSTGNGSGSGLQGTGGGTDGTGVRGIGGATNGKGVYGSGTGTGTGVLGNPGSAGGYGVWGDVPSGSGFAGVRGTSSTSATAIEADSSSGTGYALVVQGDTTSPVRAALRVVPQDAAPTGPNAVGDQYVTTTGVAKICVTAGTPGTWADVGATQTGSMTVAGSLVVEGNAQLGDAAGDGVTFNGTTVSLPNNLSFDSGVLYLDSANNRVGVNNTSPSVALDVTGAITASGALTAGSLTTGGALQVDGNTTLGNASGDTVTITGTAVTTPNGLNFDSNTLVIDAANNRVGVGVAAPTWPLEVTHTLPAGAARAAFFDVTGSGSAVGSKIAVYGALNAGYTGVSATRAAYFGNASAGTANGLSDLNANFGFDGQATATTAGANVGAAGTALGGNLNVGLYGQAFTAKNSATNCAVLGQALNTGTSPVQIGGYFVLSGPAGTDPGNYASSALIADNGATTSPIFLARDNGTAVFTIADGGAVTMTGSLQVDGNTTLGNASGDTLAITGTAISVPNGVVFTSAGSGIGVDVAAGGSGTIGIRGTGNGASAGVRGVGGATGPGGTFAGGATSGQGISAVGSGASAGVGATGGGTDGIGVDATGGATNGVGVKGTGTGTGHGVWANTSASTGYALYVSGDTSSPVRAAIRVVPQDAEPTGAHLVGDMYVTTAGVLKICTSAGTPGTWTTVGTQT